VPGTSIYDCSVSRCATHRRYPCRRSIASSKAPSSGSNAAPRPIRRTWNTGKRRHERHGRNVDIFRDSAHSILSWTNRKSSEIVNADAKEERTVGESGRPIIIHGKCVVNLAAHGGPNSELGRPRSARDKLDRVGIGFPKLLAGNYARRVRYR